jgi:uncharacterized membrane protein
MAMAMMWFGWLIVFIHDLARSSQVDVVVARVAGELAESLRDLARRHPEAVNVANDEAMLGTPIRMEQSGYIQAIDPAALFKLANDRDVIIQMRTRPGYFVIPSTVIAHVVGPADRDLGDQIRAEMVLGPKRTTTQDSAFRVDMIVEIAARAMSPGINDFYTALACIDHLAAALDTALSSGLPGNGLQDESGRLRLVLDPVTIDGLFDTAFHPLRHMACTNVLVTKRLLQSLVMLAEGRRGHAATAAIERHGRLIHQTALAEIANDHDRQTIDGCYAALKAVLGDEGAPISAEQAT